MHGNGHLSRNDVLHSKQKRSIIKCAKTGSTSSFISLLATPSDPRTPYRKIKENTFDSIISTNGALQELWVHMNATQWGLHQTKRNPNVLLQGSYYEMIAQVIFLKRSASNKMFETARDLAHVVGLRVWNSSWGCKLCPWQILVQIFQLQKVQLLQGHQSAQFNIG